MDFYLSEDNIGCKGPNRGETKEIFKLNKKENAKQFRQRDGHTAT